MPGYKVITNVIPDSIMKQAGLVDNVRWINCVVKAKANVVDIGIIVGYESPNYAMEITRVAKWLL